MAAAGLWVAKEPKEKAQGRGRWGDLLWRSQDGKRSQGASRLASSLLWEKVKPPLSRESLELSSGGLLYVPCVTGHSESGARLCFIVVGSVLDHSQASVYLYVKLREEEYLLTRVWKFETATKMS